MLIGIAGRARGREPDLKDTLFDGGELRLSLEAATQANETS